MKTYLRHSIHNVIDVKELIALEYLDFEGKYKDYTEKHDFWELCYVEEGETVLFFDGKEEKLTKEDLILIAPDKIHSYHSQNGNENRAFVVCFESFSYALKALTGVKLSLNLAERDSVKKIIEESLSTFCMNENEHLEALPSPSFGGQQALMLQLEYLLICLLRRLSVAEDSVIEFFDGENFHADLVNTVARFLKDNVNKKISLEEISAKFNYSRSFLCKIFKIHTGETLITYFNRIKIEEAQKRLRKTTVSVSDIAFGLGFREVKYFDALFKKLTGMSPNEYRRQNVGEKV